MEVFCDLALLQSHLALPRFQLATCARPCRKVELGRDMEPEVTNLRFETRKAEQG